MQFANKHFDFNTRYIQLPPVPPQNRTDRRRGFIRHESSLPYSTSEEWHLWAAAQTLLSLHHHYHDHGWFTQSSSDSSMISSSSSSSSGSPTSSSSCLLDGSSSERKRRRGSDAASTTEQEDSDQSISTTAAKTRPTTTTTLPQGVAKPRWSDEERAKLVRAVIQEKGLDNPASFPWPRIAQAVSPHHSSQACQDRWVKGMLPVLATMYPSDDTLFLGQVHAVSGS